MPYYRLFYHFVWATKEQLPLITPDNEAAIYGVIRKKTSDLNGIVHAANGTQDHIHLAVSLPPVLAPAKFIGQIKGSTAYYVSKLSGETGAFVWQDEYGVLSFSESHLPTILRYVDQQKEHHADNQLDQRLEVME